MSDVVRRAAEFATAAHASIDQRRKYSNEPYIMHPTAVAEIVATVTDDETMIAAAWLHDVVEDTPVTIEQIEAEFGEEIARLVADLTYETTEADGNRRERRALDGQHTAKASPRAKTIKLADVIHNLTDIAELDPGFAAIYLQEKEELLEVLTEGHSELFAKAEDIIRSSKELLAARNQ